MKRSLLVGAVVMSLLSVTQPSLAGLLDIPVTGTARDMTGTPLAGVRIDDGRKWVWTDEQGRYSINEPLISGFILSATKTGIVTKSINGTALPGKVVDFQLFYTLEVSLTPDTFNSSSPTPIAITARTYAPSSSCVSWQDNSTNTLVALVRDGAAEGAEGTWRGEYESAAGQPDGSYSSITLAKTCDTSTVLTPSVHRDYAIDNAAP